MLFGLQKWRITHAKPTICEMRVAEAAPVIPHWKTKMKSGARMKLMTTVNIMEYIAFWGYPVERMTLLRLKKEWVMGMPRRMILMKS